MKKTDKDIIEENEEKKPTTKKKTAKKTEEVEVKKTVIKPLTDMQTDP